MPSASNNNKLEKQASGQPALAESSSSCNDNNNANNPMKLALVTIEHKIRNLEKRKTKLESYRSIQATGKELSADQKAAVAKFDAVTQTLEFARDLSKQMIQFSKDAEKEQKKQARKEIILKAQAETAKIREVLVIQNILSCLSDDVVRSDFINGENDAVKLETADLEVLNKFSQDIQTRRPEVSGDVPFLTVAQKAAEYLSMTIDGRPKQYGGETTFENVRRIFHQIQESGYLDKIYLAAQGDAVVEPINEVAMDEEEIISGDPDADETEENCGINAASTGTVDENSQEEIENVNLEETQVFADEKQQNLMHGQNNMISKHHHHEHHDMQPSEQSEVQQQHQIPQPAHQKQVHAPQGINAQQPPSQPQRQRASSAYQSGTASPVQVAIFTQQMPPPMQSAPASGIVNQQHQQQPQLTQLPPPAQMAHQIVATPTSMLPPQQQQQQPQLNVMPPAGGPGPALVASGTVQALHGVGGPHFPATTVRAVEQGYFKQHQYLQQIRPLAEVIGAGSFYFLQDSELDSPDLISQQIYEAGQQQQQPNSNVQHSNNVLGHQPQQQQPPHHQHQQEHQEQLQQQQHPQQVPPPVPHQIIQQNVSISQQQQQHQLPPQQQPHGKTATAGAPAVAAPIQTQTFTNQSFPPLQVQAPANSLYGQQPPQVIQSVDKQQLFSPVATAAQLQQHHPQMLPQDPPNQVVSDQQQQQQPVIIMARVPQGRVVAQAALNTVAAAVVPIQAAGAFPFENPAVVSTLSYEPVRQEQVQSGIPTAASVAINNQHHQQQQQQMPSPLSGKNDDHFTPNDQHITNEWETTNTSNSSSSSLKGRNGSRGGLDVDSTPSATATQTIETNQWSNEMNSVTPPLSSETSSSGAKKNDWNNGGGAFDNSQQQQPSHDTNHWNNQNNDGGGSGYSGRGRGQNYNRNDRNRDGGGRSSGGDRGDRVGMRNSGSGGPSGGGYRGRSNNYSSQQNGGRNSTGNMYFRNNDSNSYYQNGGGGSGGGGNSSNSNGNMYNSGKDGSSGGGGRYENSNYRSRGGGNNTTRPSNNNSNGGAGGGGLSSSRTNANSTNRTNNIGGISGGTNGQRTAGRGGGGGSSNPSSYANARQTSRQQQDVA